MMAKRIAWGMVLAVVMLTAALQSQERPAADKKGARPGAAAGSAPAANSTGSGSASVGGGKSNDASAAERGAIEQTAKAFTEAFNRHDAAAVAALWTENGEYVDAHGQRYEGRGAIQKEYEQFFEEHPQAKIKFAIDSIRLLGPQTATEDGRAIVELGPKVAGSAAYTTLHTKTDGKWRMSSVRDSRPELLAGDHPLQDLEWLAGAWVAEEGGARMEVECRWTLDKRFLERRYTVQRAGKVVSSGMQMIGWSPEMQRIQSWMFSSDGGHATGVWSPRSDGWAIETAGVTADGTPTRALNLFTRLDENGLAWKSVERSAGGVRLSDTEELLLKRAKAKPNHK